MKKKIEIPTMGDFLREYMEPLHLSAYKLAKDIYVPVSRIQDILHGRRKMSIDTSMRLGKYFGQDPLFFFRIQLDLDYRKAVREAEEELEKIKLVRAHPELFKKINENLQRELDTIQQIVNAEIE